MADIRPLRGIHYAPGVDLDAVVAPPYDVIDDEQRAGLLRRSEHNVVEVDLPQGDDPYEHAAETFARWLDEGVLVRDDEPALWVLTQDYTAPDGERRTRSGFFAAVRVEDYGPGRIRPHERTHPGPKEDRLRLTRATRANLSPIFSLYSDPDARAWRALRPSVDTQPPWGEVTDEDGTTNRLWRIADAGAIATVQAALRDAELLIADGHHRYETARVYAEEVGGEGPHRYVLMCLVALEDEGLTVFPTHRLVDGLQEDQAKIERLTAVLRESFDIAEVAQDGLRPEDPDPAHPTPLTMGYLDAHFKRPFR